MAENIWTILGPEFCEYLGKMSLIVEIFNGLKSYVPYFCNHIVYCMEHICYNP